jgi:UDP-GlcNAc:undecaprenyl-phosphate GlcNAc-1-phosphate transferase
MIRYLLLFSICYLSALILTPLVARFASENGFLDMPGDELQIHKKPIPLLGGVAIFISFIVAIISASLIPNFKLVSVNSAIIGGSIIFMVGLWDDIRGVSPYIRLFAQISSGLIIAMGGFHMRVFNSGLFNLLLTSFFVAGACNSINLLDGMDGLASGVGIIIGMGFLVLSILSGNATGMIFSMILVGVLAGFLLYNFHPARIFLGDSGSNFVGFCLAFLAIDFSNRNPGWEGLLIPVVLMTLPILDTALAIARRLLSRRSIFEGDRYHLYDWLMQKGLSQKRVALILYGIGLLFTISGIVVGFAAI